MHMLNPKWKQKSVIYTQLLSNKHVLATGTVTLVREARGKLLCPPCLSPQKLQKGLFLFLSEQKNKGYCRHLFMVLMQQTVGQSGLEQGNLFSLWMSAVMAQALPCRQVLPSLLHGLSRAPLNRNTPRGEMRSENAANKKLFLASLTLPLTLSCLSCSYHGSLL